MKKIIIGLLLISFSVCLLAKKTEDMYVMRHTNKGKLFFISENVFYSTSDNTQLPFDITYLNSSDSVSLKMSIYESSLSNVDSVALTWTGGKSICIMPNSIYKDKEKRLWIHRSECMFLFNDVVCAFAGEVAPIFTIYVGGESKTYTLPNKKWEKLQPHMNEIFMIIRSNDK